jgi:hypothetical protein
MVERFCDCANCGRECLGEKTWAALPAPLTEVAGKPRLHVAGRINDRPWCNECLKVRRVPGPLGRGAPEPSPWQENVIKLLEDGR